MLAVDTDYAVTHTQQKNNGIQTEPKTLSMGEVAQNVMTTREFIYTHGDLDTVQSYQDNLRSFTQTPSQKGAKPLSKREKLELEVYFQSEIFNRPPESLHQFGFRTLLEDFKSNELTKVAGGFDEVRIADASVDQTLENIATKGFAEAAKLWWAAATYRIQ